jgi:hypothetical protein
VPAFPSTTAALRFSAGSFDRFMGEPQYAARYATMFIASTSRASVRALVCERPTGREGQALGQRLHELEAFRADGLEGVAV